MDVKILKPSSIDSQSSLNKLRLESDGNSLKINICLTKDPEDETKNINYSANINYTDYENAILQLNLRPTDKIFELEILPLMQYVSRDSYRLPLDRFAARDSINLLRMVVDTHLNQVLVALRYSADLDIVACECLDVDITNNTSMTGKLMQLSPLFKQRYAAYMDKSRLLSQVDDYDSLAYLEAQLDAVTRMLLGIVDNKGLTALDYDLINMLREANKYSILNIKTNEKNLVEFEHKKHLRSLQAGYYENKN